MEQTIAELRKLAEAAEKNYQHIYTNPRDSNSWKANEAWHHAASPDVFLAVLNRLAELEQYSATVVEPGVDYYGPSTRLCSRAHPHEKHSPGCMLREVTAWIRFKLHFGDVLDLEVAGRYADQIDHAATLLQKAAPHLFYSHGVQPPAPNCDGCAVQQGYMPAQAVVQIQEPERNKPSMSMHVSVEDYQRALADWEAEQSQLAAVQQGVQPPFMYAIADGHGQPFFEEQGCVSSEAKDLQPEVDSLNQNLDGEPPYKVVALYTHPTQQGLEVPTQAARDVIEERARQIELGYDHSHDDAHADESIAAAAAVFIMPEECRDWDASSTTYGDTLAEALLPCDWGAPEFGHDRRAQLVKGAAMAIAEIERLDRAAAQAKQGGV